MRSLVPIPESDTESTIEADDIQVEEKNQDINSTQTTAVKPVV